MRSKIIAIGVVVLALIIGAVLAFGKGSADKPSAINANDGSTKVTSPKDIVTIKGAIGSEKEFLFNDAEFQKIALDDYGVKIDFYKSGSLEMSKDDSIKANDFVFPASDTVVERIKSKAGSVSAEPIFRTPVVLYSWDPIVQPLIKEGIVKLSSGSYYVIDFKKLVEYIKTDKTWAELGKNDKFLQSLFGPIIIDSSDPAKSNSGNSYATMVATVLNNGQLPNISTVDAVLPELKKYMSKSGFKKTSTTDLFEDYMRTGVGSHKMIVGYESDLIYFSNQNPDVYKKLMETVKPTTLYPEPTMWSSHTLVALKPNAKRLIECLKDPRIQKIAWEKYGFRTGILGLDNKVDSLIVKGVPQDIVSVMPMPDVETTDKLTNYLTTN